MYGSAKQPSLAQWTGSSLNTTLILDQPANTSYTNLDDITGRVVLRAAKSIDVSSIWVKLEGESRTRLMTPGGGPHNERPKPVLEYHKILYRVQTVFPPSDVTHSQDPSSPTRNVYTLPPGQHEYRFRFKLPFNNSCGDEKNPMPTMSVTGSGLEIAKPAARHVKKTLPPTLSGFPGEAEIRYFVKATVNRHSMFKENSRSYRLFNFLPIEPPRPALTGSEVYARQKHVFNAQSTSSAATEKAKAVFEKQSDPNTSDAPMVSVDARLPEPAILTCNSDVPLRLIVKKLTSFPNILYLQSLQISLIATTKIKAHQVYRNESSSWILLSKSNMGIPIGRAGDAADSETMLDESMWRAQVLPNTVAPSFEACNISRSYQLDVRIGLSLDEERKGTFKVRRRITRIVCEPQTVVLPMRLDTRVFSGIAPPDELLQAMANAKISPNGPVNKNSQPVQSGAGRKGSKMAEDQSGMHSNTIPQTPFDEVPELPQRPMASDDPELYADAPPSYEDAIASGVGPVDAPRPQYAPPAAPEDDLLGRDEKRAWV